VTDTTTPDQLGPYARAARLYRAAGWVGTIPVIGKHPPVADYTGYEGRWPTEYDVANWLAHRGHDNVGLRVPSDVIGIDVDAYGGRRGAETIAWWEEQLGDLPPTWRSTSRPDGDSGIRFYRVPTGEDWISDMGTGSGVEVVRTGHRYAVVWPSVHPLTHAVYTWYDPSFQPSGRVPRPTEFPELSDAWVAGLRKSSGMRSQRDGANHREDPVTIFTMAGEPVNPEALLTEGVEVGSQNIELYRYVSSMRARGVSYTEMLVLTNAALQLMPNQPGERPWTPDDARDMVDRVCRDYPPGAVAYVSAGEAAFAERVTRTSPLEESAREVAANPELVESRPLDEPPSTVRTTLEVGTGPDNPHRATDRANGIEIARFLDGKALWTPQAGWHVYDGRRWAPDAERVHTLLIGEFTDLLRERATSGNVGREAETLMTRANRIESSGGLRGALVFAEPLLAHSVTTLDADPWLLNCPNGTLDLRTGDLLPHDPRHLLSRTCPTAYDPDARDETWERVLREALQDDPEQLRLLARFAGYTLTGRTTEKRMLVISGPTNTGKSTVTEPLYRALGDVDSGGYATTWDADVVQADSRVNRGEKLAKVRGARLVLVGELSKGSRMADNFVKQFTGGDTMDARALYRDSYSYRPSAKLWMATNYVPHSPDKALQERLLLLPFEREPAIKDPRVKAHLDDEPAAHRAILAWAVRACLAWQREGLGSTPWLAERRERYALASDPMRAFVAECLVAVEGHDQSATAEEVWVHYDLAWAPANVPRPLKKRAFTEALEELGLERKKGTHGRGPLRWRGYRLVTEADNQ